MSISKDDSTSDTIDHLLLSLTLIETMAIKEKNKDSALITDNYPMEDLMVGTAMLATMIIHRESQRIGITSAEWIQEFRTWLTTAQATMN